MFKKWYLFGIVQMTENIPDARFNPMTSLAKAVGPLDGRGNLPLYQELQRALRKAIDSRILGPDDALPSERDLAVDFAVSRITVRKALDGLRAVSRRRYTLLPRLLLAGTDAGPASTPSSVRVVRARRHGADLQMRSRATTRGQLAAAGTERRRRRPLRRWWFARTGRWSACS